MHPGTPRIPDHELLRPIGRGSYGEVWLARNIMDVPRAVKVVLRGQFEHERPYEREFEAVRRFEPVSRAAEGLVNVLHVGRLEDESGFYYVMELADAVTPGAADYAPRTLAAELGARSALPVAACLDTAVALARGLAVLHRAGLAHRDVKPANVIFVDGRAKLADIGLVGMAGTEASFVGTEGYIPPEGPGTRGADLYALGRVLYQMATGLGRHDWPHLPPAWMQEGNEEALELVEVLLRASEGDPARRYQKAEEMLADLALLQSGKSVRRLRALERRVVLLRRAGLGVAAAALTALAGLGLARHETERQAGLARAAEEALYHAELARAQTAWRSGRTGAREETLVAVRAAARLRPGAAELRDEAVTALALLDFPELRRVPYPFWGCALPVPDGGFLTLDAEAGGDSPGRFFWADEAGASPRPDLGATGETDHSRNDALTLSPDARWLAVLCHSYRKRPGTLHVREFQSGLAPSDAAPQEAALALEGVAACAFSPDSATLAASGWENELRFYDPAAGAQTGAFPLPGIPGHELLWSPDGERLAVLLVPLAAESLPQQGRQQPVRVLILDREGRVQGSCVFPHAVWEMAWEAHGDGLLLAAREMGLWRWRWRTGAPPEERWGGHESEVIAVAADPQGEYVVTSSWDRTTRLWSAQDGRPLAVLGGYGRRVMFLEGGRLLAREDMNRHEWVVHEVRRPEIVTTLRLPEPERRHHGTLGPRALSFSPDGSLLAAAGAEGSYVWEVGGGSRARHLAPGLAHAHGIAFDAEGSGILLGAMRPAGLWRVDLQDGARRRLEGISPERGALIMGLSTDAACRRVAVSVENAVLVWQDGQVAEMRRQNADFGPPSLSPDGLWAAAGARGGPVQIWELPSGKEARRLETAGERLTVCFSADGSLLLVGDARGLHAYAVADDFAPLWICERQESGDAHAPLCAASADGRLLAASLERDAAWLVDPASGRRLIRLRLPHAQAISCLAVSPDGQRVALGSWLHTISVWHLPTLRLELGRHGLAW